MPRTQEGLARLIDRESLDDDRIAAAFRTIDRADFVPEHLRAEAYGDRPVGIPEQQTTSQPSLIARMIDAAAPRADDLVLEVGTGFGFQTALLATLARHVVSIERWDTLARAARANLQRAGMENVEVIVGDGWLGSPEHAPFDAIVVSAAAAELPVPLTEQLADGGRLVVPLRTAFADQVYLYQKKGERVKRGRLVSPARFVPLVHDPPK
jgi:protein-L-isoaspartate(D-aspartate) O-methyltransferase